MTEFYNKDVKKMKKLVFDYFLELITDESDGSNLGSPLISIVEHLNFQILREETKGKNGGWMTTKKGLRLSQGSNIVAD